MRSSPSRPHLNRKSNKATTRGIKVWSTHQSFVKHRVVVTTMCRMLELIWFYACMFLVCIYFSLHSLLPVVVQLILLLLLWFYLAKSLQRSIWNKLQQSCRWSVAPGCADSVFVLWKTQFWSHFPGRIPHFLLLTKTLIPFNASSAAVDRKSCVQSQHSSILYPFALTFYGEGFDMGVYCGGTKLNI